MMTDSILWRFTGSPRSRCRVPGRTIAGILVTLLAHSLAGSLHAGESDQRLDIYWVDVEGGAATLVVTPEGESILFDSGNPGRRDADRIVQVAGRAAGIRRIDHLVTTHYHGDHFGGAATLSTLMPIGAVYDNGDFEGQRERPDQPYREFKCAARKVLSPGDEIPLRPATGNRLLPKMTCLAARQKFIPANPDEHAETADCASAEEKPIDNSDNANSIVTLVSFGRFEFFDAGDLTWNVEYGLVCPRNRVGTVDVYQVTHHGLDSSNHPILVRALSPTVAVMNNGVTKGCEPYTFAALKETTSIEAIYQVHKNERPDGKTGNAPDEYIANREQDCKANFIKLSVDPQGESYTITIPAHGHERTYRCK